MENVNAETCEILCEGAMVGEFDLNLDKPQKLIIISASKELYYIYKCVGTEPRNVKED